MHFNESQSNLLVQVLKNMVTPESILYSNSLSKADDKFIQLKKYSFYDSPLDYFFEKERDDIIDNYIKPLDEFYFQVDNKKKIIKDFIEIVINRKNKSLTSQQQQDIYRTIESHFNIYQANFSNLNFNASIDLFKND